MRLVSKERLQSFVGPESHKKMSQRRLARYADKHPSFINHLTSGRRTSCEPRTAELIAEALDVPLAVLFMPETASSGSAISKEKVA
ncbi:helix-turn-helix domain-containing protein [Nocardioides lijunqiniae]|uniref:helix-turn-helix domain-containing protein n=1 Tax=Nocardioides lijunqiniae TaxID=2760832 RepID=UPI001878DB33|nr:helix-turn-helix transcriptional regulator [Nocardioides lijunqiniae]